MAKTKISEWSTTPASNTDIDGINIAEGCAPSGINDAIRDLMAQVRSWQSGASGDPFNGPMNGTIGATTAYSGAFTTLSASGTTTLSGLTASTALALDASKNVVSVANTGSGSNVLATSPTLVTPALGTPSSATLTNATGLPISTGVSGLGTGVATALAVNVGSAGAPVVNGGALGTPSSGTATNLTGLPLTTGVTGTLPTANGGTNLTSFTSGGIVYASSTSALATGSALQFTGTNLGLGTTNPDVFSRGDARILGIASTGNAAVAVNAASGSSSYLQLGSNGVRDFQIQATSSAVTLGTGASGNNPLIFAIGFNEFMRLNTTGLGIGTSSPAYKLDVNGNARVQGVGNSLLFDTTGASATSVIGTTNDYWLTLLSGRGSGSKISLTNDTGIRFYGVQATEHMRLDSAGNLGLGVTPSAWASAAKALQLAGGSIWGDSGVALGILNNAYINSSNNPTYIASSAASYYYQYQGAHKWFNAPSGTAGNPISFTQAMTLDASGLLTVGTTVNGEYGSIVAGGAKVYSSGIPQYQFQAQDTTAMAAGVGGAINFTGKYTTGGSITSFASIEASKDNATSSDYGASMVFKTRQNGGGQTERARIDSSGNLLVGVTSFSNTGGGVRLEVGTTVSNISTSAQVTSTWGHWRLYNANGNVGTVSTNGSTTTYGTSSDYRLKENIAPMTGALATVAQLKPCTYTWKVDGTSGQGFIAHELQEVVPDAVVGEKDAVDEEGNIKPQGIDTSFLVATLTAAIQELKAEFDAYKASHP